ncbi:non-ribosomal peptide synthetase [Nonomuraea sediminis]|uniref:non-ribosomal peptide synthetase n=1 Tax=Nonomuraea sediminis TaxID=2835864 RepID=UPI001BDD4040|nr:amino acid adenylation domain-containing protein [Nonomuraea sediminis]
MWTLPNLDKITRTRVLNGLAGNQVDHGRYRPVTRLFEEQVDRTPDRPALSYRATTLSYRELDDLANGLAAELAEAGVLRGDVIPLLLVNSLELPLSMLALLKLGAAFVPCDPAWPAERTRAALAVISPRLVLGDGHHPVAADRVTPSPHRVAIEPGPDEVAYGVFTSGTTGTPKCALNIHRGLTNRFRFMSRYFHADGEEVVLQNSRHTFDSAIWQLLWPLTTGGHAVVPEQGEFLDLERTVATIAEHRVTITDFVPATLAMMVALLDSEPEAVAKVTSLRHLVVGGEEVGPHAVHRLRTLIPGLRVSNGYGPSEASIGMVFHPIDFADGDHIPLGRPIDNCYAIVVDKELGLLPPGEIGEIVIGGACLGIGYLGDRKRTDTVFVDNPFAEIPGDKLYLTGDLGWYDEADLLRFSGRADRQVKVDGVRIELGEVEAAAAGYPGVRQAKAVAVRQGTRTRLVLAAAASAEVTPAALREHLATQLPRTSMPHHCVVLPDLPLNDNGKVDLRAIQTLVEEQLDSGTLPTAGGAVDERIAEVLRSVLGLADFGVHDDFLASGGDSLTALTAVLGLRGVVDVRVGVQDLYELRTPAALAGRVRDRAEQAGSAALDELDEDEAELMDRDSRLPADIEINAAAPGPLRTVLVTGATGFVGARVVHQLLSATDLRVICLTRAADHEHARRRVIDALGGQRLWDPGIGERLEAMAGDLSKPWFGLDIQEWEALAARCDAVMHIGALVNFLFDYRAHRPANVLGTHEVLRFASHGTAKPLHHVSTLGVLDRHAAAVGRPLPEDFDPSEAIPPRSGYSRSKWVAERMLWEARDQGAAITVYRLGEVMPAADNGVPNPRALTHLLLTAFQRLGIRPDAPMLTDYSPVDEVAARLVAGLTGPTGTFHVFREESVDLAGLLPVREVPAAEFMAALEGDPELHTLRAMLTGTDLTDLLVDNPALFVRDSALDEGPLDAAIDAYLTSLKTSLKGN